MKHSKLFGKLSSLASFASDGKDGANSRPALKDAGSAGPEAGGAPAHEAQEAPRSARLLVLDSDAGARTALVCSLALIGYYVDAAASGHEATVLLDSAPYDLIVMDTQMPDVNGVALMERIRETYPGVTVIVLTGRPTLDSAIAAVRLDMADYLIKPIRPHDLAAVIARTLQERYQRLSRKEARQREVAVAVSQALDALRHVGDPVLAPSPQPQQARPRNLVRAGSLALDRQKRLAVIPGHPDSPVALTEGEMAVLSAMMESPNEVLSCEQLAKAAVGGAQDRWEAQSVVRPYIHRLRRKLEAGPAGPPLIQTVRGRGYFLSCASV